MQQPPKQQPPKQASNGLWIGAACLAVGYVVGQSSAQPAKQNAYAETTAPTSTSTTDMTAAPPATQPATTAATADLNALAAAGAADAAAADVPASSADTDENASAPANYQVAQATQPPAVEPVNSANSVGDQQALADAAVPAAATGSEYQPSSVAPAYSYAPIMPSGGSSPKCEGLGCYGEISNVTGLPRTAYVHGYVRSNGTYVQPYFRSHR